MRIDRLFINGFRNYDVAEVSFEPGINVISGPNAQGKTNLLEAVYMISCARSFRTRFDRELIGFEREQAEIKANIFAEDREQTVEIFLRRGVKKSILQNRVRRSAGELSGSIKAVLFCPDDLNIIKEGAAARRRLLDMAICQLRPGYAKLLSEYNRAYENKMRILRDYRDDMSMLSSLEDFSRVLCTLSAKIIRYRASFARRLGEKAASVHGEFSGADEVLDMEYRTVSTVKDPLADASVIYEQIMEHQKTHRSAELSSGACLTGAHKDDLEISINGRSARSFASQGQTRTAALSLKLAEREIYREELGEYPVLLLDDVLSELDTRRQEFVLNRIGGGQTLITCCEDEQIVARTGGKVIFVSSGSIKES